MHRLFQLFRSRGGARGQRPARPYHCPSLEALEDRLPLSASPVGLGAAGQFGVLGLQNTQITNSKVTITGHEGVSQGGKLKNNGSSTITGNAVEYSSGQYTGPNGLGRGPVVNPTLLAQAGTDALNASSQAAALAPTQAVITGTLSTPATFAGNGGLNVIAINGNINLNNGSLTLGGTASDVFIVNVSGSASFAGSGGLALAGGVTPGHVLYNFTGAGGTITSGAGNVFYGTLLGPNYSFDLGGAFSGEIIGGGKSIELSGAKVNQVPFAPPSSPPSISGHVYADNNYDGMFNSGDTGLPGVTLTLTYTDSLGNQVQMTATTDANGSYSFNGLPAGTYTIYQPPTGGYTFETSNVGTVNGSASPYSTGGSDGSLTVVLQAGDQGNNYDFGYFPF